MTTFFFYGTLAVPSILLRVLEADGSRRLDFAPATVVDYARLRVRDEEYPAIVDRSRAEQVLQRQMSEDEAQVEGTVVYGLSFRDVELLSAFEGTEYELQTLLCTPAGDERRAIEAQSYVWRAGIDSLQPKIWSLDTFVADSATVTRWSGAASSDLSAHPQLPTFGRAMLQHFSMDPKYTNLNQGSFGSIPIAVRDACRAIHDTCESNPDLFLRRTYLPLLTSVRRRMQQLLRASDLSSVVFVPNATHGINTILSNLTWAEGDIIACYSTTYGAIAQSLKRVCDFSDARLEVLPVSFPSSTSSSILSDTEQFLIRNQGRVRLIVIDAISSTPAALFPWKALSTLCRKYGALSLIDAAHLIGQIPVDLSNDYACDFLVSTVHKWLYSARGCAVMWVPKRNQHLIRSSLPTAAGYESRLYPSTHASWSFDDQYSWTGTQSFEGFLSVAAAMDFRATLGGEERIHRYCNALAAKGGCILSELLQKPVMPSLEGDPQIAMVNVELPDMPALASVAEGLARTRRFEDKLLAKGVFAAVFGHGGRWWVRASAQIWTVEEDFETLGKALLHICAEERA